MKYKYNIYKLKNGEIYLSKYCPCDENILETIKITERELDLINKAREMK